MRGVFRIAAAAIAISALAVSQTRADWRKEIGTFNIGMLADPGRPGFVRGSAEIKSAFSAALGMPVEIWVAQDYPALIDAQASGRIEYSVLSSLAYATAWRLCECVEPVAVQKSAGMRSVLISRKNAIENLQKAESARIGVAGSDSVIGTLLPELAISSVKAGLKLDKSRLVPAGDESSAIRMFQTGGVDGLLGWAPAKPEEFGEAGTFGQLVEAGADPDMLHILWQSDIFPAGPHTIRKGLAPEAIQLLRRFLISLSTDKPDVFELLTGSVGGGFVPANHDDYETAIDLVEMISTSENAR